MKKTHISIIVIGFIVLIAAITNPNQKRHQEVLKEKLTTHMQEAMKDQPSSSSNTLGQAGQALGSMLGGTLISGIINNVISTDNYVLFSTTKATWEGKTRVIGFGAFGNVFLTKQIDKVIEEQFSSNNQ